MAKKTAKADSKTEQKTQSKRTRAASSPFASEDRGPDFLPFDAEFVPAPEKRFQETVVFVHQFGGTKQSVAHHVQMVNELGFDAVCFDLMFCHLNPSKHLPITADLKFGIRHVWTEQIEAVLNSIPGRKILFSFSMPSNSALTAIAHRRAKDISGWICDGGPFLQLPKCVWNLYEHHYAIGSKLLRGALTAASIAFYGAGFEKEAPGLIRSFPANFRVLSIRGLQDPLVPTEAIDEALSPSVASMASSKARHLNGSPRASGQLTVTSHSFEDGGHLDGLKKFSGEYTLACETFLKSISKSV